MKKLLSLAALLLVSAFGASAEPVDQLLTAGGTLYTLDVQFAHEHPEVVTDSFSYFVLKARNGAEVTSEIVPATAKSGNHINPSMAWEAESGTLYIFWIRHTSIIANELLFVSRAKDGVWSEESSFGSPWNFRENLTIAATRKVADLENEKSVPGISVHAAWWEFDSSTGTESARYAMLTIENGKVASIENLDLVPFTEEPAPVVPEAAADETVAPEPAIDPSVLQHPILTARTDSVLLTFGSNKSGRIHQLTVTPTIPPISADGRIRIPVGRTEGSYRAPLFPVAEDARMEGTFASHDQMAFYTRAGNTMRYVVMKDGVWSAAHEIQLDENFPRAAAVEALRRMVNEH